MNEESIEYKVHHDQPTLRDQFAMAALTGMLANPHFNADEGDSLAPAMYAIADAMLEARQEPVVGE